MSAAGKAELHARRRWARCPPLCYLDGLLFYGDFLPATSPYFNVAPGGRRQAHPPTPLTHCPTHSLSPELYANSQTLCVNLWSLYGSQSHGRLVLELNSVCVASAAGIGKRGRRDVGTTRGTRSVASVLARRRGLSGVGSPRGSLLLAVCLGAIAAAEAD